MAIAHLSFLIFVIKIGPKNGGRYRLVVVSSGLTVKAKIKIWSISPTFCERICANILTPKKFKTIM